MGTLNSAAALPWELQQVRRAEIRTLRVTLQSTDIKMSPETSCFITEVFPQGFPRSRFKYGEVYTPSQETGSDPFL